MCSNNFTFFPVGMCKGKTLKKISGYNLFIYNNLQDLNKRHFSTSWLALILL